jgi:hypothetical protein
MTQAPSPEEIRRATEAILARPEFQDGSVGLWERFITWFFSALPAWSEANPELARIVVILLTGVLIVLLAHIAYTVVQEFASYRREPSSVGPRGSSMAALEEVGAESWVEAFDMARTAVSEGNVYRALWITHRILLSVLDRMDHIRFARWKTNSDYLIECKTGGSVPGTLAEVTTAYEQVIYAHRELGREEAARLLDRVEALAATQEP